MKHKLKYLIIAGLFCSTISLAQHTEIFNEADRNYKTAHELFIKEKYGAAIEMFDAYLASNKGALPYKINAAYYSAVSSFSPQFFFLAGPKYTPSQALPPFLRIPAQPHFPIQRDVAFFWFPH